MNQIYDPKGLMDLEFKCPKCGGSMFGTSVGLLPDETGHCHSYNPDDSRCTFIWKRSEDDKLGVFVKKIIPTVETKD